MILQVRGLGISFGGLVALAEVSFELPRASIYGVIGPNGAGKTTLFNVLSGVNRPDTGSIQFLGKDITALAPYRVARLGLSRTYQVVRPLNELTVLENAMVGACFGRLRRSGADAAKKAADTLSRVGLGERADQLAGTLNLAEKKRLELARALSADPHVLLLDEVLAGLNPTEVTRMLEIVRGIRDEGVAILMIEHVMRAIMSLSDHVLVLEAGRLLAEGTPAVVAANPRVIEAYLGNPEMARIARPPEGSEHGSDLGA
jgi:branched-chain amino acid transport system ATP-binding protein